MNVNDGLERSDSKYVNRRSALKLFSATVLGIFVGLGRTFGIVSPALASVGDGCCNLVYVSNTACAWYCGLHYHKVVKCWPCGTSNCLCCECTEPSSTCFTGPWYCSYNQGAC